MSLDKSAEDVHGDRTTTGTADNHIGLVLVVRRLSSADGSVEVIVVESRIDDCVAVLLHARRFDAAWNGVPAVEEEDFHGFTACTHRKCRST